MQRLFAYFRQFGHFQRNARLYLWSNALSGVTLGIFLVLYNLYLTALGFNADFVGATLFAGTLGAALAIFPAGFCIDRWSGKWILIWSSFLIGVVGVGTVLFRQAPALLASAFLMGVAAAFILVLNAPYLTRNSEPGERTELFSLNIVLTQIATVLGEVVGGALPTWFQHNLPALTPLNWVLASQPEARSYQIALLVAGALAIPSFLPLFLLQQDVHPSRIQRRAETTSLAWRERVSLVRHWTRKDNLRAFVQSPFFILVLVQILTGLGAGLLLPYFNLFFVRHLHANSALFGLIDGAANGLTALTTLLAPWLARRIGRINAITLTRLLSLPILLAIGFTGSLPVAAVLYPLREGTMDMTQGILQVFSMEEVAESSRGLANSIYQATNQVAWAITSSLGGLIIVSFGYSPLFVGTGIFYLLSIALVWGRFGTHRPKSEQVPPELPPVQVSSKAIT